MKLETILKISFISAFIIAFIGAFLKITHSRVSESLLLAGVFSLITFIVCAIYEVRTSKKIDSFEKTMWTIAFVFMSGLAGLIYILIGRKRVVETI